MIAPKWRVLDVGSGDHPFELATVLVDHMRLPDPKTQSSFRENPKGSIVTFKRPFVSARLQSLPFRSKTFDFVFASHVLEHCEDLHAVIGELNRVAPRGFIEVPRAWFEFVDGSPYHRWLFDFDGTSLIARPKTEAEQSFTLDRRLFDWNSKLFCGLFGGVLTSASDKLNCKRQIEKQMCHISLYWESEIPLRYEAASLYSQIPGVGHIENEWKPGRVPITVIVHTRNEAEQIEGCLASCNGWASEILVADMESSDGTVPLVRPLCSKVIPLPFRHDFDAARNASAEHASNEWILFLDADELLTNEIKATIEGLLKTSEKEVSAYQLPFRVESFGRWIQHAGNWWPSYKSPPLLRKGKFYFPGSVHTPAQIEGAVVRIKPKSELDAIVHKSHRTVEHYFEKLNRYTSQEIERRVAMPASWVDLARSFGETTRWFHDETHGTKDGLAGFLLSVGSGVYELVAGLKHLERVGVEDLPPSAEAFYSKVAEAARLPLIEPTTNSRLVREWHSRLLALLQPARSEEQPRDFTVPTFNEAATLFETAEAGTFCVYSSPNSHLESDADSLIHSPVHLLEVEDDSAMFAFSWKGPRIKARTRVLFVAHSKALQMLGGGEVQLFQSIRSLERHGFCCDVAVGAPASLDYDLVHIFSLHHSEEALGLERTTAPVLVTPIYWDRFELQTKGLQLVRAFECAESEEDIEATYLALRAKHGKLENGASSRGSIAWMRHANAVLPNAQCEADLFFRSIGLKPIGTHIVPNGCDAEYLERSTREPFVQQFALEDFVLCVGRIEPNKNQLSLIWALRDSGVQVVLIGHAHDQHYASVCKRIASPHVHFLGDLPRAMVASAMRAAAAHCLPSFGETPGLANLEAAAVGCPLVVSDRGAEQEYFGSDALVCDPLNPESIRMGVMESISTRHAKRCQRLQSQVLRDYSWQAVGQKLANIYNNVLSEEKDIECVSSH